MRVMRERAESRRLPVEGARNLRDVGGYPTYDGRTVRHGLVLRGGHPGNLTVAGRRQFEALGLQAIVDLRTTEERDNQPYDAALLGQCRYWSRDYALSHGDMVAMLRNPATSPQDMHARMLLGYRSMIPEQSAGFTALFHLLAERQAPVLVNCTAGKDRTGVTIALLLSVLGVRKEAIIEDYATTELLEEPGSQLFHIDPDGPFAYLLDTDPAVWKMAMRSDPDYLAEAFSAIDQKFGGAEAFVCYATGFNENQLRTVRDFLLEG